MKPNLLLSWWGMFSHRKPSCWISYSRRSSRWKPRSLMANRLPSNWMAS
jgi:hypothetical protein